MAVEDRKECLFGAKSLQWVAAPEFTHDPATPLPLIALTDGCSLQQYAQRILQALDVPFVVAHSASGVSGLQSALSAGLGVACLNASAIPDDVASWRQAYDLPRLPDVEFSLLSSSTGKTELIKEVQQRLAEHLA